MSEKILVVPRSALFPTASDSFYGFKPGLNDNLWRRMSEEYRFISREIIEGDHHYKQLIPYLLLRYQDQLFLYQRIGASVEKRLLKQYSFGLGGHINPAPGQSLCKLISFNLHRELLEEVSVRRPYSYHFLGYLNDETNDVGKDHLGLVYLISCSSPEIAVREQNKLTGRLIPVAEAVNYQSQLETWSCLLLAEFHEIFH